jgi:hypothetical protein
LPRSNQVFRACAANQSKRLQFSPQHGQRPAHAGQT